MTHPAPPTAFILSTGSETTDGVRVDTNAPHLSRLLTAEGFRVTGHTAIPDDRALILDALNFAAARADLLVMTGGIGPTEDDLTREALAEWLGAPLHSVHRAEAMMRALFTKRGRPMPERNVKQALLPEGALPLLNFWGTAMGILVPARAAPPRPMIVAMPGVPAEWQGMWRRNYARLVAPAFPGRVPALMTTLHVANIPESEVNAALLEMFGRDCRLEVALLASLGVIRVRLSSRAPREEAAAILSGAADEVRRRLPPYVVFAEGADDLTLEAAVIEQFRAAGRTLALAESCTGGLIAARLTDIPNASQVLREGWVTYSNAAKQSRLGVRAETLAAHGAVSEFTAREMAAGALAASGADVALSVSGIAGPTGGTPGKPVGLVWFGWADSTGQAGAVAANFPGGRDAIRTRAVCMGLDLLRRWAAGAPLRWD